MNQPFEFGRFIIKNLKYCIALPIIDLFSIIGGIIIISQKRSLFQVDDKWSLQRTDTFYSHIHTDLYLRLV